MSAEWQREIRVVAHELAAVCFSESVPEEVVASWIDYADDCLGDYLQASKQKVKKLREESGLDPEAFLLETRRIYFREFEGVVREHAKVLGKSVESFDPS